MRLGYIDGLRGDKSEVMRERAFKSEVRTFDDNFYASSDRAMREKREQTQ